MDELHSYLTRKVQEVQDVQKLIQDADHLNHRQLALLSDAIHHADHVNTYRSHAASHRVTEETPRTDLLLLYERGLLRQRKMGRKHAYSAVPDLPSALQAASP
ncbi:MAG: hypothetical protein ACYDA6_08715 [Solirubrobacteraceae bacterium]